MTRGPESVGEGVSKHTPGPWCIHGESAEIHQESDEDGEFVIADIDPDNVMQINKASNARLIAAAPDLLHALECLQEWVDNCFAEYANVEVCNMARAAIAKVSA